MSKLYYNVYSNITERQFFKIEKKMALWQDRMSGILFPSGWLMQKSVKENDALIVDFTKRTKLINGNIGITFDDIPGKISFTMYVTKSFDENNYRYFLSENIFEAEESDFFEGNISIFTDKALKKFSSWHKENIINLGEKDKLS